MILLHGTTRKRAEQILQDGPDLCFREPGGLAADDGFSLCLEAGPFPFGTPEQYAWGKAKEFPDEGGPAILIVDVPEDIIAPAINDWFPLSQGLIQFDRSAGLEELISTWQNESLFSMNHESPFLSSVRSAFQTAEGGTVGLVDHLLCLCQEWPMRLDWKANRCRIQSIGPGPEESVELPFPKSVFRAILARLATLCNEHRPGSVSPYEGQGELAMGGDPSTLCRVVFVNTPSRQEAQLIGLGTLAHGVATTSRGELSISQQSKSACG